MKMRAVVIDRVTPAAKAAVTLTDIPSAGPGQVLIKVLAFGLNHSEQILRHSEIMAPYIKRPVIPGIECVGVVEDPSDSRFHKGEMVTALMGGMGRNFDGSYAEYVAMPAHHVFGIRDLGLPLERIAAVPETWFTAFGSLFGCLKLTGGDTLLIRGATCALGYAALMIAHAVGARTIATTHKRGKLGLLKDADEAILDEGQLGEHLGDARVGKVLDLVGPLHLRDSLRLVAEGGIVCCSGILGGEFALDGFNPITDIRNGTYLTGFYSNYPRQGDIDAIFAFLERHHLTPPLGQAFTFERIREALIAQDQGGVDGKIVVTL
ncbi:MAG: zinc-binding dehydrogenase [Succinivibrionaceae bacterium]|nr:zinc-binding dehydrogenase [Succinivibrionaceae bacterium]